MILSCIILAEHMHKYSTPNQVHPPFNLATLIKIFFILSLKFFESRHQVDISPTEPPAVGSGAPGWALISRVKFLILSLILSLKEGRPFVHFQVTVSPLWIHSRYVNTSYHKTFDQNLLINVASIHKGERVP